MAHGDSMLWYCFRSRTDSTACEPEKAAKTEVVFDGLGVLCLVWLVRSAQTSTVHRFELAVAGCLAHGCFNHGCTTKQVNSRST